MHVGKISRIVRVYQLVSDEKFMIFEELLKQFFEKMIFSVNYKIFRIIYEEEFSKMKFKIMRRAFVKFVQDHNFKQQLKDFLTKMIKDKSV